MAKITNKLVQELNEKVGGNKHQLHSNLCKLVCKNPASVNASSLQITVNRMLHHINKLKHARNMDRYKNYLKADFRFPRQLMKRKLETDADSHEKIIQFQESQIISLKARYRNANIAVFNQEIRRLTETIVRLKDEIRSLKAVKKETSNKYMSVEAGVQCNTLKIYVSDLEKELDNL
jgi:lipase chaperone LimK